MSNSIESGISIGSLITLPTAFGHLQFRHILHGTKEGILITSQEPFPDPVPVRVQSSCLFSESFLSEDCDCAAQLRASLNILASEGGALVYLYEEGRGAGLRMKIEAISKQQQHGYHTVEAYRQLELEPDLRDYTFPSAVILSVFGASRSIELLTNNPNKVIAFEHAGIKVAKRRPLVCTPNEMVEIYLSEKSRLLGHKLNDD